MPSGTEMPPQKIPARKKLKHGPREPSGKFIRPGKRQLFFTVHP